MLYYNVAQRCINTHYNVIRRYYIAVAEANAFCVWTKVLHTASAVNETSLEMRKTISQVGLGPRAHAMYMFNYIKLIFLSLTVN